MSSESDAKGLTVRDPVSKEVLLKFEELDSARYEVASQLLTIEQERVRLLAAAHQIDLQRQRLFEATLTDRGLEPSTRVQIDSKTGAITLLGPTAAAQPAP